MIIDGDILAQFGIKGMKWGVRKATTRGSTPPSKRKPKEEPAAEKRQSLDMHAMSDTELRNAINRIKLQREYAQLTAPPPKEKSRGRQVVENIVYGSAEAAGKKVLTGALTNVLNNVLPPALREAPKKSKTDEVAEKVLKGLKGEGKGKGGDDSQSEEKPKPSPKRPSPGDGPLPAPSTGRGSGNGRPFPPPPSNGGSGGGGGRESRGNPFRRRKKASGSSQPPPVRVPDATVNPKPTTPESHALPFQGAASQGRPGHSGSGRSYDNDASNSDRRGGGAEQGRPGSTGKRKKRRFGFGHEGLDGIVVDILGEID